MTDLETLKEFRETKVLTDEINSILVKMGFTKEDIHEFGISEIVEHAIFDILNPE